MEPGYGIYNASGHLKFPFHPRTQCQDRRSVQRVSTCTYTVYGNVKEAVTATNLPIANIVNIVPYLHARPVACNAVDDYEVDNQVGTRAVYEQSYTVVATQRVSLHNTEVLNDPPATVSDFAKFLWLQIEDYLSVTYPLMEKNCDFFGQALEDEARLWN
ncbi:glycoside hydrolase family 17 protein [Gelatoporia subvermispora B]|uniref:Glycoside hydrolase family 17 protein n=1 Tax=Ceriporiopsis subvermispora (strain B) TaxID=914234 RepID=M2P9F4_CERS8|nr:glycoside hydrolase family 17 protein [Gelatoporia subvermispora B]